MYSIPNRLPRLNCGVRRIEIWKLSTRESEVFELMGYGNTTIEIAGFLGLQRKTIETHQSRIKAKMNLRNGIQLICVAALWVDARDRQARA